MLNSFDWDSYLADFSAAAEENGFHRKDLFESEDGPLVAWEKNGEGPVVYISAGIHGDEPAGPLAALEMMKRGVFSDEKHWIICPALNPSGLATGLRENRAGMDLNRDYLLRLSPEVAAHADWLSERKTPDLFISLHEDWESHGFYFYEINLGEDMPERAAAILSAVSEYFPPEPGPVIDDHEVREAGWIYHGAEADLPDSWPEAIFLAKRGCPLSFTFETPSKAPLGLRIAAHINALTEVLSHRR